MAKFLANATDEANGKEYFGESEFQVFSIVSLCLKILHGVKNFIGKLYNYGPEMSIANRWC